MTEEEVTEQARADPDAEANGEDAATDGADAESEDQLDPESTRVVAEVAVEDAELATELEAHLEELETARREAEERAEDFESRLKRKQADFQNYKKRAKKRQEQIEATATEELVTDLLDVRDNLVRALDSEHEDVESLREGVEMTLNELDRAFESEDVTPIDPEPGAETDPQRHEVMMRVESDRPAGTIAEVYQPGYEMGEKILRPAQVTVSEDGEE